MIIDGKQIAQTILSNLQKHVDILKKQGVTPHLVILLIGDDPASETYVKQKVQKGEAIGIKVTVKNYQLQITNYQLLETIQQYNNNNNVHGIIVQRPLPDNINPSTIDRAVDPKKDVDGFHPQTKFSMPLGLAVLKILEEVFSLARSDLARLHGDALQKWLKAQTIVIIGKGETGGGPVIKKLRAMNIEPKIVDSKTHNPSLITKNADIIISAVGRDNILKLQAIKKSAILISVGMHKGADGKLHGDYEEERVKDVASYYTPTPGGVGPVNVAMLLENVVKAAENFAS